VQLDKKTLLLTTFSDSKKLQTVLHKNTNETKIYIINTVEVVPIVIEDQSRSQNYIKVIKITAKSVDNMKHFLP